MTYLEYIRATLDNHTPIQAIRATLDNHTPILAAYSKCVIFI